MGCDIRGSVSAQFMQLMNGNKILTVCTQWTLWAVYTDATGRAKQPGGSDGHFCIGSFYKLTWELGPRSHCWSAWCSPCILRTRSASRCMWKIMSLSRKNRHLFQWILYRQTLLTTWGRCKTTRVRVMTSFRPLTWKRWPRSVGKYWNQQHTATSSVVCCILGCGTGCCPRRWTWFDILVSRKVDWKALVWGLIGLRMKLILFHFITRELWACTIERQRIKPSNTHISLRSPTHFGGQVALWRLFLISWASKHMGKLWQPCSSNEINHISWVPAEEKIGDGQLESWLRSSSAAEQKV